LDEHGSEQSLVLQKLHTSTTKWDQHLFKLHFGQIVLYSPRLESCLYLVESPGKPVNDFI